jgi:voltage-gated sodium channel
MPGDPGNDAQTLARRCQRVAGSGTFQQFILGVIVLNAGVLGLETSPALLARFGALFDIISQLAQAIFVVEIGIRLTAYWPRPRRFFAEGWNTFDFIVVALAFVPATGGLSTIARLARVLRVTRLVSALPELRLVFETMVRSIPSIAHILVLLGLFLYVYAVVGFNLYAATDPDRWGSLGAALLTLFQVLTLEGWNEVQGAVIADHPWSWVFFASFIVVAVWVVTNLFVAVIINNLEAAKQAEGRRFDLEVPGNPIATIAQIRDALDRLEHDVRAAEQEIRDVHRDPGQ